MPKTLRSSYLDSLAITRAEFEASQAAFDAEAARLAGAMRAALIAALGPFEPACTDLDAWRTLLSDADHLARAALAHWHALEEVAAPARRRRLAALRGLRQLGMRSRLVHLSLSAGLRVAEPRQQGAC